MHRPRNKTLGLPELIAIALGGMVGGGIFTVLGISAAMIGMWTPVAIVVGGAVAGLAAYSYVKLGVFYRDEGATYSFFKRTFPHSPVAASAIGWYIIFGYISTLALYAYTFAAYVSGGWDMPYPKLMRSIIAAVVLVAFAGVNLWSVQGMGRLEDFMVYTKLVLLAVISVVLMGHGQTPDLNIVLADAPGIVSVLTVASLTFVSYEGFQLVINATNEMEAPAKNIPRAIYAAICIAIVVYVVISVGALVAIPVQELADNQEDALAAGATAAVGAWGRWVVIVGAVLATLSAISGTMFGSSRQMAVVANDGFFPHFISSRREDGVPANAILVMAGCAIVLVFSGGLRVILEFGSITFLLISFLMAYANHRVRHKTNSSPMFTWAAMLGLGLGAILIVGYEITQAPEQVGFIVALYVALTLAAIVAAKRRRPDGTLADTTKPL